MIADEKHCDYYVHLASCGLEGLRLIYRYHTRHRAPMASYLHELEITKL